MRFLHPTRLTAMGTMEMTGIKAETAARVQTGEAEVEVARCMAPTMRSGRMVMNGAAVAMPTAVDRATDSAHRWACVIAQASARVVGPHSKS